jgi:hypothetical protein
VYTSEEVIRIMRDKLIRLQKLYIDQFQRLRYVLKEERRGYRMAVKREQVKFRRLRRVVLKSSCLRDEFAPTQRWHSAQLRAVF